MTVLARRKCKMLVIITRLDSKWVQYKVCGHHISGSRDMTNDVVSLMPTSTAGIPSVCRNMKVNDKWTISMSVVVEYTRDYWGEHDMNVYINRAKVLKRRVVK